MGIGQNCPLPRSARGGSPPRARSTAPLLVALVSFVVSCTDDGPDPAAPAGPERILPRVLASSVEPNPHNAISAVVRAQSENAAALRVEFGAGGELDGATPDFPAGQPGTEIPVLGLLPETVYEMRVVVTSASGDTATGPPLTFRTGRLPDRIVDFEVVSNGTPEPGYTLLAPIAPMGQPHPAVIVDNSGRVVWYRETPSFVVDFQLQPNGHYTAAVALPNVQQPYFPGVYEEWDLLGNVVGTWSAAGVEFTDYHEIRLVAGGQEALLLGFVAETHDISQFGGPTDAVVVGNVLQRVTRGGGVLFEWNSFDHYDLRDADDFAWQPRPLGYDFTHANAIEVDGNAYLLSTRHLSEITKIEATTGEIVWRMGGGKANQFTFLNDPHEGFFMPHSVRRLENGNLILLDNGNFHAPPSSRAVEYRVDEQAKTATLVWSFEPGIFSCCMGYAQRLPGGNTLVTLGEDYRVFEVSPGGSVIWELRLPDQGSGFFGIYRAFRVPSLYGSRQ